LSLDRSVDDVDVEAAWQVLKSRARSQLIDVRTRAEWTYVGMPDLGCLSKRAVLVDGRPFLIEPSIHASSSVSRGSSRHLASSQRMTSSSSAVQEAEVSPRLRPWQQWVTVPVTTWPAALKGRSTTRGIGVPSEAGRRPVFPGCKVSKPSDFREDAAQTC
jgi:hypothetical protein